MKQMIDAERWRTIVNSMSNFFRECFYKGWNKEFKTCKKCEEVYPDHDVFFGKRQSKCKECSHGSKFVNIHTIKIFKQYIPEGYRYCVGCDHILPEDESHFTKRTGGKFYSKCKLCRGFKSYGVTNISINAKLAKDGKKKCKYCLDVKNIDEFPKIRNTQVQKAEYCNDCSYIFKAEEKQRRNQEKNKKLKREYDQKYYKQNKEKLMSYYKEWRLTDRGKEVRRSNHYKRESMKKNLLSDLTEEEWKETKKFFNEECAYCGTSEEEHLKVHGKRLAQEHITPLSKDGVYTNYNIIPSCVPCNSSKDNMELEDFYEYNDKFTKERFIKIIDYLIETR